MDNELIRNSLITNDTDYWAMLPRGGVNLCSLWVAALRTGLSNLFHYYFFHLYYWRKSTQNVTDSLLPRVVTLQMNLISAKDIHTFFYFWTQMIYFLLEYQDDPSVLRLLGPPWLLWDLLCFTESSSSAHYPFPFPWFLPLLLGAHYREVKLNTHLYLESITFLHEFNCCP